MDVFANLYEGGFLGNIFHFGDFSEDIYNADGYVNIGLLMLISCFFLEAIYYYFITNYRNFYKKKFWFIWIAFIGFINFFTAYYLSTEVIYNFYGENDIPEYSSQYFSFSLVNFLWSLVFSFVFSLVLKIKSTRGSNVPF